MAPKVSGMKRREKSMLKFSNKLEIIKKLESGGSSAVPVETCDIRKSAIYDIKKGQRIKF